MICAYMYDMDHRAKLLMRSVSIKELNASGDAKEADRWKNLRKTDNKLRVTTVEIERLRDLFPQYSWWLMTGEVMPEIGQLSPEYEIADAKLHGRSGE